VYRITTQRGHGRLTVRYYYLKNEMPDTAIVKGGSQEKALEIFSFLR
jgi:hypothetical protein